jgi:hypothetical protein
VACVAVAMRRLREGICVASSVGKRVNNPRAIARQLLGKRVLAATDMHATVEVLLDYNNGNGIVYVVRTEIL